MQLSKPGTSPTHRRRDDHFKHIDDSLLSSLLCLLSHTNASTSVQKTAWFIIAAFRLAWYALLFGIGQIEARQFRIFARRQWVLRLIIVLLLSGLLFACRSQPAGFHADEAGHTILSEPDLFARNSVFEKDKISYLQCQVNTGAPMQWDKKYHVKVSFWDKYGKGRIENSVTISIIDEP